MSWVYMMDKPIETRKEFCNRVVDFLVRPDLKNCVVLAELPQFRLNATLSELSRNLLCHNYQRVVVYGHLTATT